MADPFKEVIHTLLGSSDYHSVTKFLTPKSVVRATRPISKRRYKSGNRYVHTHDRGAAVHLNVTIGKPNFRERKFIKHLLASGVKFPLNSVWIKSIPVARASR